MGSIAEGLVKLSAHREVVVSPLSVRDIHEIFEVRLQLDPYAGQRAAETATDAQLRAIQSLVPPAKHTGHTDPLAHNRNFHRAIYTCSGNQLLADILDSKLWQGIPSGDTLDMQTALFQPVGGMGRIGEAFGRELGPLIRYDAKVTEIHQDDRRVTVSYEDRGAPGTKSTASADWCLCTIPATPACTSCTASRPVTPAVTTRI